MVSVLIHSSAYDEWIEVRHGGMRAERTWCEENFISGSVCIFSQNFKSGLTPFVSTPLHRSQVMHEVVDLREQVLHAHPIPGSLCSSIGARCSSTLGARCSSRPRHSVLIPS